jgi:deoxyadenosine/deoxycytidine kinase
MIGSMLEKFYESGIDSRKRTGAMLQIAFLTFRYQQLKRAIVEHNAILDSSLESDFVMAKQLHDHGEIDDVDYNIYTTLSQEMQANVNGMPWSGYPDLAIYLKIDPEKEIEEIQGRGREMEDIRKDPELVDYYHRVNKAYREWSKGYTRGIMLTIDRDKYDFVNNLDDRNAVLNQIEQKLVDLGKLSPEEFEAIRARREPLTRGLPF